MTSRAASSAAWVVTPLSARCLVSACGSSAAAPKVAPKAAPKAPAKVDGARFTTLAMQDATAYTPKSINGGTDDYHCTLVDPHVTENSFIVSSQFFPGTGKPSPRCTTPSSSWCHPAS